MGIAEAIAWLLAVVAVWLLLVVAIGAGADWAKLWASRRLGVDPGELPWLRGLETARRFVARWRRRA